MEMFVPIDADVILNCKRATELTNGYVVTAGSGCGAIGIDLEADQMRRCEGVLGVEKTHCGDVDGCRPTHRPKGGPATQLYCSP